MQSRLWIIAAVLVVLLVVGVVFLKTRHGAPSPSTPMATSTNQVATTTYDLGNGITATGPAGAHVELAPTQKTIPQPNLNHQVTYSAALSPEVLALVKTKIASTTSALKKDPTKGNMWLQLAVYYKTAGDFTAAENVWIYMTKVSPTSPIAFQDLGDLYQNFLKNYTKAEANYLTAVKLDPHNIDLYRDLYWLYKNQLNEPAKANAIIAQGLKSNPDNPDLLKMQTGQ
jgi:tetratricopeptide (TPR) repeat protein